MKMHIIVVFFTCEGSTTEEETSKETTDIPRRDQVLESDNKVHANIFSVITFQESDKVFPKITKTAGRLHQFEHEWQKITSDNEILSYIRGCSIDFDSEPLPYAELTNHDAFSKTESDIIDNEIEELLSKGAIKVSEHEHGEVISPIFIRYKKDGSPRPIINLKNLNQNVSYAHFKMETLKHALDLISEGCWLASLDMKDAYFHVKIDQKF